MLKLLDKSKKFTLKETFDNLKATLSRCPLQCLQHYSEGLAFFKEYKHYSYQHIESKEIFIFSFYCLDPL